MLKNSHMKLIMCEKDQNGGVTKSKCGMTCPDQCLSLQVRLPQDSKLNEFPPRGGGGIQTSYTLFSPLRSCSPKKKCVKKEPPRLIKITTKKPALPAAHYSYSIPYLDGTSI